MTIGPINLTPNEKALWDQIHFQQSNTRLDHDKLHASVEPAKQLTHSLLAREAIPSIRLRYFTDPELNIGGHGKSRKDVFKHNNTSGKDIINHPQFIKYLRYFISGPDLASSAISEFILLVRECDPITSGDTQAFCGLARKQVRNSGRSGKDLAEEYFKLGLELGMDINTARSVRDSVMRMKTT